jgi:hypothetical protein
MGSLAVAVAALTLATGPAAAQGTFHAAPTALASKAVAEVDPSLTNDSHDGWRTRVFIGMQQDCEMISVGKVEVSREFKLPSQRLAWGEDYRGWDAAPLLRRRPMNTANDELHASGECHSLVLAVRYVHVYHDDRGLPPDNDTGRCLNCEAQPWSVCDALSWSKLRGFRRWGRGGQKSLCWCRTAGERDAEEKHEDRAEHAGHGSLLKRPSSRATRLRPLSPTKGDVSAARSATP